ncbi:MAG: ATP-binding protein, partial [Neisseriaceae bacterium]
SNSTHNYVAYWKDNQEENITKSFKMNINEFTAVYPLRINNISDNNFGYLIVKGKLPIRKVIDNSLIELIIIIFILAILLYILLIPLATQIPQNLILKPIQHIISVIENNAKQIDENQTNLNNYVEIINIENQIKTLIALIDKQSKDAAIGTLAREIAHDIKSPLSVLEYCKDKIYATTIIDNHLSRSFSASINSIKYILVNLLNLKVKHTNSEKEEATTNHILLHPLIEDIIVQKTMEYHNQCDFRFKDTTSNKELWIFINPDEFKHKIYNLISNAFEATELNQDLRLINFSISNDDANVFITISDNGCGIESGILEKVKSGYSTKPHGNGIGLSSAIRFFEENNGKLSIESEPNSYTTINIQIKVCQPPEWLPNQIEVFDNVIILDDDMSIHYYIQSIINKSLNVKYFTQIRQLENWISENNNIVNSTTFFIDYTIEPNSANGVELINKFNLNKTAFLLTNEYNLKSLQQNVVKYKIKMIPKPLMSSIENASIIEL